MYVVREENDGYKITYSIYLEKPYTGERNDIPNLDEFILFCYDKYHAIQIASILNRDEKLEDYVL